MSANNQVICIGGGPAGLTAAYLLSKQGAAVTVFEADAEYLGGISRTARYKEFRCDIGGHRFFSKSQEVSDLWLEILDEGFIKRPRKSRIYYNGKFFDYPLKAGNALRNLGVWEAGLCVLSYFKALAFPRKNPANFEEWVSNRFGHRLFSIFFRSYTEKVWGMKCAEISADWAAQRIKGLSLWSAVKNMLLPAASDGAVVKTLIGEFHYPRHGPGMMWDAAAEKIRAQGGTIAMGCEVVELHRPAAGGVGGGDGAGGDGGRWRVVSRAADGEREWQCGEVISSAPLREVILNLQPSPPEEVLEAARALRYRDFLIVALVVEERDVFDDQWIYIHDPQVKVGRIQNFKAWSPEMSPVAGKNCYGMEYFCFEGDGIWARDDADLIALATRELTALGLASEADVSDGFVVRQKKAYPVYDDDYARHVQTIRDFIAAECPGLHLVGRNGMHKYNNQDHAMMTAMLTVQNILAGEAVYDPWNVNQDAEYHEEARDGEEGVAGASGERMVPQKADAGR